MKKQAVAIEATKEDPPVPLSPPDESPPDIVMWTMTYCSWCAKAKEKLLHKGLKFQEINVNEPANSFITLRMREVGMRTLPQIWFKGTRIGGYDDLVVWLNNETH